MYHYFIRNEKTMNNARLLLLIPALLLSSCGDAENLGTKVSDEKASKIFDDIRLLQPDVEGYVVDYEYENGSGDKVKETEKVRYKAKTDGKNFYLNVKETTESTDKSVGKTSFHTEFYLFTDKTYGTVLYYRNEDLITKDVTEYAYPQGGSGYSYSGIYSSLVYNSHYSYAMNFSSFYSVFDIFLNSNDDEDSGNKKTFYSSGKGNLSLKLTYKVDKKSLLEMDYEDVVSGRAVATIDKNLPSKLEMDAKTTYNNKQVMKIKYSYPKSVKVVPPEGWEDKLTKK